MILKYKYYPNDDDQIRVQLCDPRGDLPPLNGRVDSEHIKPLVGRDVTDDCIDDDLDFIVGGVGLDDDDLDAGRRRYLIDLIEQSLDSGMEVGV